MLTPAQRKLAAHLLERAAEEFSNHGCNDLDLVKEVGLTPEESVEVRTAIQTYNGDPEDTAPVPADRHYTMDWMAMQYLKSVLLKSE